MGAPSQRLAAVALRTTVTSLPTNSSARDGLTTITASASAAMCRHSSRIRPSRRGSIAAQLSAQSKTRLSAFAFATAGHCQGTFATTVLGWKNSAAFRRSADCPCSSHSHQCFVTNSGSTTVTREFGSFSRRAAM